MGHRPDATHPVRQCKSCSTERCFNPDQGKKNKHLLLTPPFSHSRPFRIEGEFETFYEGFILSGPANITTPSGGTHLCDGTNNNANPAPIVTGTTQINDAGMLCGFGFDGTYSNQFQDFFITTIGSSSSTGSKFW
jgi:hypothetical protein